MRIDSHHAILSGKLLHPRKAKRQRFHPYRLTFIFFQRRRHDYHMAFSLLESVHRIISPASSLSGKLLHLTQNKSGRASTIPLDVYLFPTQTTRLSLPEFVHRIAPPVQTILTSQTYPESCCIHEKQSGRASTIPLDVYFLPTQTARLPHGVFSTRICASNRSANADT